MHPSLYTFLLEGKELKWKVKIRSAGAGNLRFTINPPFTWLNAFFGQIPHFPQALKYLKCLSLYNQAAVHFWFIICKANFELPLFLRNRPAGVQALIIILQNVQKAPILQRKQIQEEMYAASSSCCCSAAECGDKIVRLAPLQKLWETLLHKSHFGSLKPHQCKRVGWGFFAGIGPTKMWEVLKILSNVRKLLAEFLLPIPQFQQLCKVYLLGEWGHFQRKRGVR